MRTTSITNIATKKNIGEKRIANLKKAIRNRDRRLTTWTKKMYPDEEKTLKERYTSLARGQYLPGMISIDFSHITTVKEYNALMRMLTADKTKAYKVQRTSQMRDWLKKAISKTIYITPEFDPELYAKINTLTDTEILRFRIDYPSLVKRVFDFYSDDSYITVEERDELWDKIRGAFGLGPKEDKTITMVLA